MATFVLLPGAGGFAWYWHRVVPLLEQAGHAAIAVDLPGPDAQAGLEAYADRVVAAIGQRTDVVLVAQSMGAFTAALVSDRMPERLRALVFANAMIPLPAETAGDWWENTGAHEARMAGARRGGYSTKFDLATYFFHDLPKDIADELIAHERDEADIAFSEPATFKAWPEIPLHVVVGQDDRLFPADFQARLAHERLGTTVDMVPGGHLNALSHPRELAERLLSYGSASATAREGETR
jgi:pimeloyl-ACP methyl ester carboxylesterase